MNIIIDSNILFSALIKNSATRSIILDYNGFFLFPEYIFVEMEKHKEFILDKSKMNDQDFKKLLELILKKVVIVSNEVLIAHKAEAIKIVENIDINDVTFVACALAYNNSVIWSDDKKLKKISKVKVINTKEFIEYLSQYYIN